MRPKALPWETPLMIDAQSDNAEVIRTCCLLFDRKSFVESNN